MMILPPPTKLKNSSIVLQAYFKQYFPLLKEKPKKSISVYKVQLYVMVLKKIPKDYRKIGTPTNRMDAASP